ncbi:MAG TPA: universal stress protein [Micromonospora sp.]
MGRDTSGAGGGPTTAERPRVTPLDAPAGTPVVVGVDRSGRSLSAVRLAAREARLHDRPLHVLHSFNWLADPNRYAGGEVRREAEQVAERAVAAATAAEPGLPITCELTEGPVASSLLRESNQAALLVIGDGGLLGCTCVPLDRTSVQVAARAGCTVLISRASPPPAGPVVVGVDGSPGSHCALEFAFVEARRRGRDLVVVRVTERHEAGKADPTGRLTTETTPWRRRYPDVRVHHWAPEGDPTDLLVRESQRAELTVVGSRGEQPWRGMLGAVAQSVLYHSPAPVAVVRGAHRIYVQSGQDQ